MTEVFLTRAIRRFLADAFKLRQMENRAGERVVPKIINGYMPPKTPERAARDYPLICVRAEGGTDDGDSCSCDVAIICGAYDSGDTELYGHDIAVEMMTTIRIALRKLPMATLEDRYQLVGLIEWETDASQPFPYWQVNMLTHWNFQTSRATGEF